MNIFHKVTLESLKKNKTRTIVTIIGIMLSAAMICAVTTTVVSFQNYLLENEIYREGDWHGHFAGADKKTLDEINASSEVSSLVYNQQLGYATATGSQNEYKPYLFVIGAANNFENVMPVHITSGHYPTSSKEILLPLHLSENGGVTYKIGDTLTLDLGARVMNEETLGQHNPCYDYADNGATVFNDEKLIADKQRSYTVVGFYERPNFEEYAAPGYTAITLAENELSNSCQYDIYFKMKNPKKTFAFMENWYFEGDVNTDVLMYSGAALYDSFYAVLYNLAAIIIVLIVFGSVSLIYNAFSISVSERTKQFGLLSSIGATKKQLKSMVFFEALTVSLIGIPLGIIVGIGGIGVTLMFIGQKFASFFGSQIGMSICVSWESVIIACILALITVLISAWIPSKRATKVSAIEAIRQTSDINAKAKNVKTAKLTYRLFGLPGMLASKYYKRDRKKYRATVISLFMSIVLFVSASAFTDYLTKSVEDVFTNQTYDLVFRYNPSGNQTITEEELLKQIQTDAAVTDAVYAEENYQDALIDRSYLTDDLIKRKEITDEDASKESALLVETFVYFINDEAFRQLLQTNHLEEKDYFNESAPLGIAIDGSKAFDSEQQKYVNINYLKSDCAEMKINGLKEIEGYYLDYTYEDDKDGKMYCQYVNTSDKADVLNIPEEEASVSYTLKTGAKLKESPYYATHHGALVILYPQSAQKTVCPSLSKQEQIFYITSDNHNESYAAIKKTLSENGLASEDLYDYAESAEGERNLITIIRVFAYGFIVLISLIAAANVFNTISTNLGLRRREFAMLKSIGLGNKGLNKMMNFECLLYGSRALILGLPVSAIFAFLIYCAVSSGIETNFQLPWAAIGIAVLSVFTVVFSTMMYAMTKIKKENPIDALKNENI